LRRSVAVGFGFTENNFIGSLPQDNEPEDSWCDFFWKRRLEPQMQRAVGAGRLESAIQRNLERLRRKLPDFFATPEPPSRLHGDLWGGNLHVDADGMPCLIDPAVYGGHREMDLGMMRLFGGFSAEVFDAYAEAYPLAPGYDERIMLTQLYPLLVHVNLFGGGYAESVKRILNRYM